MAYASRNLEKIKLLVCKIPKMLILQGIIIPVMDVIKEGELDAPQKFPRAACCSGSSFMCTHLRHCSGFGLLI